MKSGAMFSVAALIAVLSNPISDANAQQKQPMTYKNRTPVQRAVTNPSAFEMMRTPPTDLPYMPQITPPGSTFLNGMKKTKDDSKNISLNLRYGTREQGPSILRYYADSLKQLGWKVYAQSNRNLSASYKGNQCTIQLATASGVQYATDFQIIYQLKNTQ